jgi:hypothetical protein
MTTLSELQRDAAKAAALVSAAKAEQAARDAATVAEAASRSVAWSWQTIVSYGQRQAEASAKVTDALAAFSAAVVQDLALAARLYLEIVRAMASANALGEDLVKARHILRTAGKLPRIARSGRDPVGGAAPFGLTHGTNRLPSFVDLLTEAVDKARTLASRAVSAEDPDAFDGKATPAMQTDARRLEWTLAMEYESLLAVKVQQPAMFAKLSAEEQADTLAYEATREAADYSAELPKIAAPSVHAPAPHYAPNDTARFHLFGQPGPDSSPLEPSHSARRGI